MISSIVTTKIQKIKDWIALRNFGPQFVCISKRERKDMPGFQAGVLQFSSKNDILIYEVQRLKDGVQFFSKELISYNNNKYHISSFNSNCIDVSLFSYSLSNHVIVEINVIKKI